MSNVKILSTLGLCVIVLVGCNQPLEPTARHSDVKSGSLITSTAGLTHIFVHDNDKKHNICTHPAPDATFDQAETGDFNISLISVGGDEGSGGEEESEELEMAGRTPAVLMTRELFFRTCEFSQNYELEKEEAMTLFSKTLDVVQAVWATEAANTTVTIGDTVATTNTGNFGASLTSGITQSATDSASSSVSDSVTSSTTEDTSN